MNEPITVLVEYQIRPEATSRDEWLTEWRARAEDARVGEPETGAYAAAVNLSEPLNVLVFERYQQGAASLKAHMERDAHATLISNMGSRNMTKRRVLSTRATDLDYGWWRRTDAPGNQQGVYLTVFNMRFNNDAQKSAFLDMARAHIEWCRSNEPDSLIMGLAEADADADREIDLKAGDLLLINGYTDEAAFRRHHEAPEHVAFSERVKASGNAPENLFFRTYLSTGDGFLWRD